MWSAILMAAVVMYGPPTLVAPTATVDESLRWDAPAQCPTAEVLRATVERHLGLPLAELDIGPRSVSGTVTGTPAEGWSLQLSIETTAGTTTRTLHEPHDCGALVDAAALLVAMALDPGAFVPVIDATPTTAAADHGEPPPPAADEARVPPSPPPTPSVDVPPIAPAAEAPLRFVVGASTGLDWGTLHAVSPIGRVTALWQLPRLRVGLGATFGGSPRYEVPVITQRVSVWMWTIGAEVGPVLARGAFEFPITAGVEAGQLVVNPRELLQPPRQQQPWAAFVLAPAVAWVPRPWLAVAARVGTTFAFVRRGFAIEGVGVLHAPARVGIRATVGLEFRFLLSMMKTGAGGNQPGRS
jgi:hypothetical protein